MKTNLELQINALKEQYSTAIANAKSSLEEQMATMRATLSAEDQSILGQIEALQTEMDHALTTQQGDYESRIAELRNSLSQEAARLDTAMAVLESNYRTESAQLKSALEAQIGSLQALLQQADDAMKTNLELQINALKEQYSTAIANAKSSLEEQMATMRATLSAEDQSILNQITALQTEMNHALATQQTDYENKIAELRNTLSQEDARLYADLAALENNCRTESAQLKNTLEAQIAALREMTAATTDSLQTQIDDLTMQYNEELASIREHYDGLIAELEGRSSAADAELRELIENYAAALRSEMTVADEALRARLQTMISNLSGAVDGRLEMILGQYDDRIQTLQDELSTIDANEKTELETRKLILEEQWRAAVAQLNTEYGQSVSAEATPAELAAREKEHQEKIAEVNLEYQRQILEITARIAWLPQKSAAELMSELARLREERAQIAQAIAGTDYNDKAAALTLGHDSEEAEKIAALQDQIRQLQTLLDAVVTFGEVNVELLIAKIEAGDARNVAEMETMKRVLQAYCDEIKTRLSERIADMEEVIAALQNLLTRRMRSLENRLKYSLMTDETLAELQETKKTLVDALANRVAALTSLVESRAANGEDVSIERSELAGLLTQYWEAGDDLNDLDTVMELRNGGEYALHRKWIAELRELAGNLQKTVTEQNETLTAQQTEIAALKTVVQNLENALRDEIARLNENILNYVDDSDGDLKTQITDLVNQLATLRENVVTLAGSSYTSYGSAANGTSSYSYSGASNKDIPADDRDLRTGSSSQLDF